jgi:hypothetical protein
VGDLVATDVNAITLGSVTGTPTVNINPTTAGRAASPTAEQVLNHLNTIPALRNNVKVLGVPAGPFLSVFHNSMLRRNKQ